LEPESGSHFSREPEPNWNLDPGFLEEPEQETNLELLKRKDKNQGLTEV
jgi:hypothetical protein